MSFADAQNRIDAVARVENVMGRLRTVHNFAKELRDVKALYLDNTDPTFNAAFNAIFNTSGDRAELAGMIDALTALVITDWEANHAAVLGL